jgi:uncharacterized membrane protein YbhN (UPF0104 family)
LVWGCCLVLWWSRPAYRIQKYGRTRLLTWKTALFAFVTQCISVRIAAGRGIQRFSINWSRVTVYFGNLYVIEDTDGIPLFYWTVTCGRRAGQ